MKYWSLFMLRMMARIGLGLATCTWIAGLWGPGDAGVKVGATYHHVTVGSGSVIGNWYHDQVHLRTLPGEPVPMNGPSTVILTSELNTFSTGSFQTISGQQLLLAMPAGSEDPFIVVPGLKLWTHGLKCGAVQLNHWLLCLTFLIATVATSVSWKQPVPNADQESAND